MPCEASGFWSKTRLYNANVSTECAVLLIAKGPAKLPVRTPSGGECRQKTSMI